MKSFLKIPSFGLGTWKSSPEEVTGAVKHAISVGYRHIDCAACYENEDAVGKGIKEGIDAAGIKREDLWITSKLWCTEKGSYEIALDALEKTLKDLQCDYLDLYLIHWPLAFEKRPDGDYWPRTDGKIVTEPISIAKQWEIMEKLLETGKVKHIGVSNFTVAHLYDLLTYCKVKPALCQVELHPYNPQNRLVDFCLSHGISVTAYSPLGSGDFVPEGTPSIFDCDVLKDIAKKHDVHPSAIALRWATSRRPAGLSVIPKSAQPKHIESNLKSQELVLSEAEIKAIDDIKTRIRMLDCDAFWEIPLFC
ncbi:Aldose reductase [Aduncisulcus paluster]|uniref:Aldose reductase n=1 Tax=Aduncisulcus paluster TaxID=2918883 RepID=A0ABQ5KBB3_9EUKA|nr:Aldose reductase [Aduncisulcus paluster]